jgi:hypothetical protein
MSEIPVNPTPMDPDPNEALYPAVEPAFTFVVPTYQLMVNRLEAVDTRLTALMTAVSYVTLGIPVFATTIRKDLSLQTPLFRWALVCACVAFLCGLLGRSMGGVILPNPKVYFEKNLGDKQWEFKKNAIFFAGQHFDENAKTIRTKGYWATAVSLAFFGEISSLALWVSE